MEILGQLCTVSEQFCFSLRIIRQSPPKLQLVLLGEEQRDYVSTLYMDKDIHGTKIHNLPYNKLKIIKFNGPV